MRASELITYLQNAIEYFNADPHVLVQISDDNVWNERDIYHSKTSPKLGRVGYAPTVTLEYAPTLLGIRMDVKK